MSVDFIYVILLQLKCTTYKISKFLQNKVTFLETFEGKLKNHLNLIYSKGLQVYMNKQGLTLFLPEEGAQQPPPRS